MHSMSMQNEQLCPHSAENVKSQIKSKRCGKNWEVKKKIPTFGDFAFDCLTDDHFVFMMYFSACLFIKG